MKKKRYFIYAYDEAYQGLHGIYDWLFFEGTFNEACELGLDMSYDVIHSYSFLLDELNNDEELINDDLAYEVWEVQPDAPNFTMLNKMDLSPEKYIEEFCIH